MKKIGIVGSGNAGILCMDKVHVVVLENIQDIQDIPPTEIIISAPKILIDPDPIQIPKKLQKRFAKNECKKGWRKF